MSFEYRVWEEFKQNASQIMNEIWGEQIGHPFFRRIFAFLVDYLFYCGVTLLCNILVDGISLEYSHRFAKQFPVDGVVLSAILWILYLSLLGSGLYNGQTIGKRIFHIRILRQNSSLNSVSNSLVRAVLNLPLFFSYSLLLFSHQKLGEYYLFGYSIVFVFIYAQLFFFIANRNRQTLVDLICSTHVVSGTSIHTSKQVTIFKIGLFLLGLTAILLSLKCYVW